MLDEAIRKIIEETVTATLEKLNISCINQTDTKEIMNPEQLADYLGMSESWVYQNTKELPHEKRGRKTFFDKAEIDEWRKQKKEGKEVINYKSVKMPAKKNGIYKIV